MEKFIIPTKKLNPSAMLPVRQHKDDAGADVFAISKEANGNQLVYGIGLAFAVPAGFWLAFYPRSSVYKTGLMLCNSVGVIDAGYRGEVAAIFYHIDKSLQPYQVYDRIGQLVVPGIDPRLVEFKEVIELPDGIRGIGGLGSTGGIAHEKDKVAVG